MIKIFSTSIIFFCCLQVFAQVETLTSSNTDTSQGKSIIKSSPEFPKSSITLTKPPVNSAIIGNLEVSKNNGLSIMTSYEFWLSLIVLIFGLILIAFELYIIKSKGLNEDLLVRFILITLIVTATLFLITAGYSNDQMAPAIGLFGTVAGYLLGKGVNNSSKNESEAI